MIQFIGPTLQFLIAIWLYHEPMNPVGWVSFAFIWGGVGLYVIDRVRVARNLRKASRIPLATPEEPQ
jgi:chloramphenicol-sensitive protein RarD